MTYVRKPRRMLPEEKRAVARAVAKARAKEARKAAIADEYVPPKRVSFKKAMKKAGNPLVSPFELAPAKSVKAKIYTKRPPKKPVAKKGKKGKATRRQRKWAKFGSRRFRWRVAYRKRMRRWRRYIRRLLRERRRLR